MYPRRPASGFGKPSASGSENRDRPGAERGAKKRAASEGKSANAAVSKPLKRPSQARARFTVQAIYDAFVRIWRERGWEGVTTRSVALETGIAVGTFYEYFPDRHALLSGYVRHCLERLLEEIDAQAIAPSLAWQDRVARLVSLTCGEDEALPWFDADMLAMESRIAEPKHHQRAFDELSKRWRAAIDACADLPARPAPSLVDALFVSVWGGRRYRLLLGRAGDDASCWPQNMVNICIAALSGAASDAPALSHASD